MKDITALVVLAGGVVALLTALITLKAKKREAQVRAQHRASVLSIDDPTVQTTYRDVRRLRRRIIGGLSVFMLTLILIGTIATRDITVFLMLAGIGIFSVCLNLLIVSFVRTEPPSRTMKTARIILAVGAKKAMGSALAAVEDIGASVAKLDSEHGIIEARVATSILRTGALIKIKVSEKNGQQSEIVMSSDATLASIVLDFGSNGRNVRRLKTFIAGSSSENT